MDALISSIRKQTHKLRATLIKKNRSEQLTSKSFKRTTPKTSPRAHNLTFSPSQVSADSSNTELSESKNLIENLTCDNKMLHEDIQDFKLVLEKLSNKFKETKRELEVEKLKNTRIDILENQIAKERTRKQNITQAHCKLKERYLGLISVMRDSALTVSGQEKQDTSYIEQLAHENRKLRELMAYSKISDPNVQEIEKVLKGETEIPSVNLEEYREKLKSYRQQRIDQKRSKSFAGTDRKNYLLMSPGEKVEKQDMWNSFFKK
eukprot:CAMPEP_0202439338 /NCGR_PEP_ID=MMETSP1345-20130828/36111_1 /ASSEMBLY_ACC=CAM_ASM_000843 /TAXON_ID=342563 /ORGANISM="Fabrea Fabrea salina" /LENGTH=262 /DNA_ID=CAMNT_0049053865 /DNA_START=883 /DNA_END=1668 /DNA_ORIENTATION=+